MHGRRGDHSCSPVVCYLLTWRINCNWYRGLPMFSRKWWHNFTSEIVKHYRLLASISISCPNSLFETACRNAFQWRWSDVLEVILTCLPLLQLSRTENVRLYWRSVFQTIPSIFVSANCDIFNNQTHPAYIPAISVLHYGMFEVKLMNNMCIAVFFPASVGKGLAVFLYCFHTSILIGFQSTLRGVIRQLYTHCFCLFGSFHTFYWNHHFDIQSDEICTLLTKRISYTFKWYYGILDSGQISWVLDSVHDTSERLGCQMFALKFIQHVDHFRTCKHRVP